MLMHTACTPKSWKDLFAPNGKLNTKVVATLCYGADDSMFHANYFGYQRFIEFYEKLYDVLGVPDEIRRAIDRENILMLGERK